MIAAGPILGSFFGLLADRLPRGEPVLWDRSRCRACGRPLGALDLVPIVSFLLLKGRCRTCSAPISAEVLFFDGAGLVIAAMTVSLTAPAWWGWGLLLGFCLLTLSVIDAHHRYIPDVFSLGLVIAGLGVTTATAPDRITDAALAAGTGYGLFWSVNRLYRRLRGFDGLGLGDAKLLAAGGAWCGLVGLPSILLWSSLGGLFYALALRLRGRAIDARTAIAFGPFLAGGIWLTWLVGPLGL